MTATLARGEYWPAMVEPVAMVAEVAMAEEVTIAEEVAMAVGLHKGTPIPPKEVFSLEIGRLGYPSRAGSF